MLLTLDGYVKILPLLFKLVTIGRALGIYNFSAQIPPLYYYCGLPTKSLLAATVFDEVEEVLEPDSYGGDGGGHGEGR